MVGDTVRKGSVNRVESPPIRTMSVGGERATMVAFSRRVAMDTDVVRRPKAQLGTCLRNGGSMFRQFGQNSERWVCSQSGLITHGGPTAQGSL